MKVKVFMVLCVSLLIFGAPVAFPQEEQPAAPSKETKALEKPVMLGNQTLFNISSEIEGFTAAKRAREISKRITKIADSTRFSIESLTTSDFNSPLTLIVVGDEIVMSILDQDAVTKGKSRQVLAAEYAEVIRSAIEKYRRDRSLEVRIYGAVYTLIATIIFIAVLIFLGKFKHKIDRRIDARFTGWKKGLQIQSFEIVRGEKINEMLKGGIKAIRLILVLIFLYIYLQLVLGFFPLTRSVAEHILDYVLTPLKIIGKGFVDQIPNLVFLTILVLLARYILKVMRIFFLGIEKERVKLPGFYPEWAKSTYRLLSYLVIAFFVVVAFPYIPGSGSLAFKGVSVFVGVLFSLGSQSAVPISSPDLP